VVTVHGWFEAFGVSGPARQPARLGVCVAPTDDPASSSAAPIDPDGEVSTGVLEIDDDSELTAGAKPSHRTEPVGDRSAGVLYRRS
jgi:hypothetical protein